MKYKALLGAVALACTALTGQAQTIQAKLTEISPALSVKGSFDSGNNYSYYTAGVNQFESTSSSGFDFEAFCVEPDAGITVGDTLSYTVTDLSQLTNSDKIAKVIGGFLASSQNASQAAAAQWAIWELVAETSSSYSLSSNKVKIKSGESTQALANSYLSNLDSFTAVNLTYLTNSKKQDMITWDAVPEPSSLSLLALSAGLLFRRKR
ncbi:PEP-CTERM sorting domain-containing protein [Luteolibacter sp. AS25]|uniref:PEP-CTERM sorting domain-containing protein n=1 Tax=Luteolibacter sp. AS25 TaxID=3135776 RepID=UPI00398B4F4A